MATIRFPSPLTLGLAQGIPQATSGILDVLKLLEQRRHREALEAGQARQLTLQEQAAQRVAGEFARVQGLRERFGPNLATVAGGLRNLQPGMIPGIERFTAEIGEPEMVGPMAGVAARPPMVTRPDVTTLFQDPRIGTALQEAAEVNAGLGA